MTLVTVKPAGTAQTGSVYVGTSQSAIQNAINYVAGQGGGTVFIEAGTYTFSAPVTLASNVELCGEGDATVLRSSGSGTLVGDGLENVRIHDLKIDGSRSSNTASDGIRFTNTGTATDNNSPYSGSALGPADMKDGFLVEDVTFQDSAGYALYASVCRSSAMRNCHIEGALGRAVFLSDLVSSDITANRLANNQSGIYATDMEEVNFTDNDLEHQGSTSYGALHLVNVYRNEISGNQFRNNRGTGLRMISTEHCSVSGNLFANNSQNGLHMSGECRGNQFAGNAFFANGGNQAYLFGSGVLRSVFAGNTAFHGGDYGVNVAGAPNTTLLGNVATANYTNDLRSTGNSAWIGGNVHSGVSISGSGVVQTTNYSI